MDELACQSDSRQADADHMRLDLEQSTSSSISRISSTDGIAKLVISLSCQESSRLNRQ